MKRRIALLLLAVTMLAACGAAPATEEETGRSPESAVTEQVQTVAEKTPQPTAAPAATQTPAPPPEPSPMPTAAPTATPEPVVTPTPTAAPTEAPVQQTSVSMSYGGVPFELAAGTEQWWSIDSSDSAYWAVLENINAMRAAGGLAALPMEVIKANRMISVSFVFLIIRPSEVYCFTHVESSCFKPASRKPFDIAFNADETCSYAT